MELSPSMLRFADFELDRGAYELRRGGRVVGLERIPFDLLVLLAQRRDQPARATRSWSGFGESGFSQMATPELTSR